MNEHIEAPLIDAYLPLSAQVYHILLSIADEGRHGVWDHQGG